METAKPVTAHDVAAYILSKFGPMTAMKLQKLVYYSQAWSLVWEEERLFNERIEAWINGPIVPELYYVHKGQFTISTWPQGKPDLLEQCQRETVDAVIGYYGDKPAQYLSDLTHSEDPWKRAREGLRPDERGDREISISSMHEYYSGIQATLAAQ